MNTSAPRITSARGPDFRWGWSLPPAGLGRESCRAGRGPKRPSCHRPPRFFNPRAMSSLVQAVPAAPAPLTTALTSSMFLPTSFKALEHGRDGDHRGAVLVIVEHRDIQPLLQFGLHLKAAGGGNILQVDAAEGTGDHLHRVDDLVHILGAHADGKGVDAGKGLEQAAFNLSLQAFQLRGRCPQTQNSGAIGDHPPPGCPRRVYS